MKVKIHVAESIYLFVKYNIYLLYSVIKHYIPKKKLELQVKSHVAECFIKDVFYIAYLCIVLYTI